MTVAPKHIVQMEILIVTHPDDVGIVIDVTYETICHGKRGVMSIDRVMRTWQ